MLLSYRKIKSHIPHFNERPVTADDFYQIASANKIEVCERKLKRRGYHVWHTGDDYIFIRKTLNGLKWLETAMHELIHALTSIPMQFMHGKQQIEANALALIALIPQPLLFDKWKFLEENPTRYARKLWDEREKVYFLYGV